MLTNNEADVDDMSMDVVTNQQSSSTTIATQTEPSSLVSQSENQPLKSSTNSANFFEPQPTRNDQSLFRLVPVSSSSLANPIAGIVNNESLTSSVSVATSANESNALQYTCVHCDIIFKDKVLYTVHRGSHGFNDPFTCNLCGTELKDKYAFAAHFHC